MTGITSVAGQLRHRQVTWSALYATTILATLTFGALAVVNAPRTMPLALALVALVAATALLRPLLGLYVATFLTLVGDAVVLPWYPFAKNLSSPESASFLDDAIIVSPLEIVLLACAAGLGLKLASAPAERFRRGALLLPLLAFAVLVAYGLLRGLTSGGDANVALFEARPLLYVPIVYILVTNLVRAPAQMIRLFVVAMAAITVNSLSALWFYRSLTALEREEVRELGALGEHGASVHIASLVLLALAVWLFPRCSTRLRLVLAAAAIPSVTLFVLAERRAAVIALGVGLLLLCVFTFHRNRRAFWWFVPVLAVITVGYLGAFWNTETGLGFPAQAVKGVIAPGQLSEADQSSNAYRDAESFNIWTTIRASPVLGIGFGQRFYRPIPMADISFFVFWEYLPHNAFLWMWMKTGVVGFLAYLYLSGLALQAGARSIVTARRDQHAAVIFTGLTAVAMFLVFSYVDIAWGARTALFLGVALACCADFPRADDEDDEDDLGAGAAVLREAMVAPDRSAGVEREAVLVDGAHTR